MRIIITLLFGLSFGANAQTASNFTINDVDGISRDLFTELDNGNVVALKFFTDWCGICHNTADDVVGIYNGFQSNGDPVVFWALNRDANETNSDAISFRNAHNIPFPVIGEASAVAQQFGVQYQPEYRIIRPDRSYVSATNYTAMENAVNDALNSIATSVVDIDLNRRVQVAGNAIVWNGNEAEKATVRVVDMSGRVVVQRNLRGGQKIELDLPVGVYVYRFEPEAGEITIGKVGIAN